MKLKAIAVMAAAAALSLAMAGSALASPLSAKSKPAPQVTGTRLQSALLPASAFGAGFTVTGHLNTGKKLWSTKARLKPSSLSCRNFAMFIYVGGFGNTAGAVDGRFAQKLHALCLGQLAHLGGGRVQQRRRCV